MTITFQMALQRSLSLVTTCNMSSSMPSPCSSSVIPGWQLKYMHLLCRQRMHIQLLIALSGSILPSLQTVFHTIVSSFLFVIFLPTVLWVLIFVFNPLCTFVFVVRNKCPSRYGAIVKTFAIQKAGAGIEKQGKPFFFNKGFGIKKRRLNAQLGYHSMPSYHTRISTRHTQMRIASPAAEPHRIGRSTSITRETRAICALRGLPAPTQ